jgi:hypothetical protein
MVMLFEIKFCIQKNREKKQSTIKTLLLNLLLLGPRDS